MNWKLAKMIAVLAWRHRDSARRAVRLATLAVRLHKKGVLFQEVANAVQKR